MDREIGKSFFCNSPFFSFFFFILSPFFPGLRWCFLAVLEGFGWLWSYFSRITDGRLCAGSECHASPNWIRSRSWSEGHSDSETRRSVVGGSGWRGWEETARKESASFGAKTAATSKDVDNWSHGVW